MPIVTALTIAAFLIMPNATFAFTPASGATAAAPALPPLIINVSPAPNVPPALVTRILNETDAIWRAEGFTFVWQRTDAHVVQGWRPLPSMLHVTIGNEAGNAKGSAMALGWIGFDDAGRPEPEIVVSYANARAFIELSRDIVGSLDHMTRAERDGLLGRAMGRALAHELAHYFLETKTHTLTGLLQATRSAQEFFGLDRIRFRLDKGQRALVAERLRRGTLLARG